MSATRSRTRDRKTQRKARKALLAFLARLRKSCGVIEKAEVWYELLKLLEALLQEHEAGLPEGAPERLREAARLTDATREGLNRACRVLQLEVENTISALPPAGIMAPLPGLLLGAVIAVGLAVGVAAAYFELTAVEVVVENHGCAPIMFPAGLLVPGLDLPAEPIPDGGQATAEVPRVNLGIEIESQGAGRLTLPAGIQVPLSGTVGASSITFDGEELLGRRTSIDLGAQPRHRLVISCLE